jgi:hypothetical protein
LEFENLKHLATTHSQIMMRLDVDFFENIFQVPTMENYTNISIQHAQEAFEKNPNEVK